MLIPEWFWGVITVLVSGIFWLPISVPLSVWWIRHQYKKQLKAEQEMLERMRAAMEAGNLVDQQGFPLQ